ncbi:MAG: hypothetical protein II453_21105 [Alphaproteobacteria bacterium]|nr:hypothetical protein [Alphaproteobacteria bacterium]MBQ3945851.1 hypothetical protein [Alphaproteobacteria bacterium]
MNIIIANILVAIEVFFAVVYLVSEVLDTFVDIDNMTLCDIVSVTKMVSFTLTIAFGVVVIVLIRFFA